MGRSERVTNLVIATGHAMMGLAMAPITGQLVAQLLAGEPTRVDLAPLNPDRFVLRRRPRRIANGSTTGSARPSEEPNIADSP